LEQRRARRTLWAIRLVVYPVLIGGAVLLLAGRSDGQTPVWLDGTTSQGGRAQAELVDGRVARLSIDVRMRCPSGIWAITWTTRQGPHVTETTTHHYRFHDQTGRRTIVLDARVADGSVEGIVTSTEHFVEPGYGPYDCASGPVSFSARAG
jgi:hypothetical protein